jgi:hypothetical protein
VGQIYEQRLKEVLLSLQSLATHAELRSFHHATALRAVVELMNPMHDHASTLVAEVSTSGCIKF